MKGISLLLCVCTLVAVENAMGQARLPRAASIDPATGLPSAPKPSGPRFDLDFPGGKPATLLQELKNAAGERPNAIIQPDCHDLVIPPFQLHDVTASQVFTALNLLANYSQNPEAGTWQVSDTGEGGQIWLLTRQPNARHGAYGPPGMGGAFGGLGTPAPVPAPRPRICRVFNLGAFLEEYTVEDITTAVQGAWELLNPNEKPSIKYHKDTRLLIVVGEEDKLMIVSDVLRELRSGLPVEKAAVATAKPKAGAEQKGNQEKKPEPEKKPDGNKL